MNVARLLAWLWGLRDHCLFGKKPQFPGLGTSLSGVLRHSWLDIWRVWFTKVKILKRKGRKVSAKVAKKTHSFAESQFPIWKCFAFLCVLCAIFASFAVMLLDYA